MERKDQPVSPDRATHFSKVPHEQNGSIPSQGVSRPIEVTIKLSLSQEEITLLRHLLIAAEALLAKYGEPTSQSPPNPPPAATTQVLPDTEQSQPAKIIEQEFVADPPRRRQPRAAPTLTVQQEPELTEDEQEEFRAKYAISLPDSPFRYLAY
jgi:hypothetical protein